MKAIKSKSEYKKVAETLFNLMNKGEKNLTKEESNNTRNLALAIQAYEKDLYPLQMPKTLSGMIDLKMYERKLSQEKLSKKLKISPAKFCMIIRGKQKPDVSFLKNIRKELDISADFILDHV